jgi:Calcineurin-like phosphoesterase
MNDKSATLLIDVAVVHMGKYRTIALRILFLLCILAPSLACNCLCGEKANAAAPLPVPPVPSAIEPGKPWHFAVSGDSRNCGDVVMPAIAQGAARDQAKFYWHLGDLRAIYDFDEDMLQDYKMKGQHLSISDYVKKAWADFRQNQTVPFGGIPFFLGIGNHETVKDLKDRDKFSKEFADFLDSKELKQQRETDAAEQKSPAPPPKTYYHWVMDGVDFIFLDNATDDQFDADQMKWFEERMARDGKTDSPVHTVVVGMHKALPYSISQGHSMNESARGEESGRQVYQEVLKLQNEAHKKVFVLASHSHFYMEDIFNTEYWRSNGGVLAGWIVGTAGAQRYPLPEPNSARVAKTNIYGYLVGAVNPNGQAPGTIQFEFKEIEEQDVPQAVVHGFSQEFVHWCFAENTKAKAAGPSAQP